HQGAWALHLYLYPILTNLIQLFAEPASVWQQTVTNQHQKSTAHHQKRNAHPGQLKQPKVNTQPALEHAVHHQIGTGADQRTSTAQNGRITQWKQQLRDGNPQALSPVLNGG